MHVLLTEATFGDCDPLYQPLRDNGCRVSRCRWQAGVWRALAPASSCPLDDVTDPPGLMVDVRDGGGGVTAREFGVVCALRARVSVVLVAPAPGVRAPAPAGLANRATIADVRTLLGACRAAVFHACPAGGRVSA
ncbi:MULTISPECIES: hypothetical protein [unclassified Amycolatopsis]|uniref:hypothetical protein n=1 Tax=unclassified Amycolatopsis TaxID=2618356 RepID=UPI001C698A8C|nr:hypothetical protein [Amycolatopsis sp. DSM 110486]QYN20278.1 hypothetical protein K1T34_48435 [Amycolatopsis sp. DSM 110486]